MSTNSIIGRKETGKGRYCHWDGYPTGVGIALINIIREFGVEEAMEVLNDEYYGWSHIEAEYDGHLEEFEDDGRFAGVQGFGVAYTTEQGQSSPDEWYEAGYESYSYMVDEDGVIDVYEGSAKIATIDAYDNDAIEQMEDISPY